MISEQNLTERVKHLINATVMNTDTNPLNTSIMLELKQNTGKPLLVELQDGHARRGSGCWDYGGTSHGRLQLYLGIIDQFTPFRLSSESRRVHFPTTDYVKFDGSPFHPQMVDVLEKEEGNIVLRWNEIPDTCANWNLKSKLPERLKRGSVREMNLLLGEQVEHYFSEKFSGEWIPFYLHCCTILDYDVSPQTKGKVVENIRKIEEKARVDHNEQIKRKLVEARELKLDQGNWNYEPRPGITINGPKYLAELCKRYEIR